MKRYRLLKELFKFKTGSVFEYDAKVAVYFCGFNTPGLCIEIVESNPDWFRLIQDDEFWRPEQGEWFYFPSIENRTNWRGEKWENSFTDNSLLDRYFVCKTKEDAVKLHDLLVETARRFQSKQREVNGK